MQRLTLSCLLVIAGITLAIASGSAAAGSLKRGQPYRFNDAIHCFSPESAEALEHHWSRRLPGDRTLPAGCKRSEIAYFIYLAKMKLTFEQGELAPLATFIVGDLLTNQEMLERVRTGEIPKHMRPEDFARIFILVPADVSVEQE